MMHIILLTLTALLCGIGILISALSLSGAWLVLAAALVTFASSGFPTTGTLTVFILLCVAAEIVEALAGWFGVQKRGGSKLAGLAALIGGLAGAVIGSGVFPIIGTFLGMLSGSFSLAFLTEWLRLKHHREAVHIAWGTVWARLIVTLLKTLLTIAMAIWLLAGFMH